MEKLPDSSFFSQTPFAGSITGIQAAAEASFQLDNPATPYEPPGGKPYKDGLGPLYSQEVDASSTAQQPTFKFMNRQKINQFCFLLSVFGVDMMENGLKNLQFNANVNRLIGGYPKSSSIPYVKAHGTSPDTYDLLSFMKSKTDNNGTAPTSFSTDENWEQLTPSFVELSGDFIQAIKYYPSWAAMQEELSNYVGTAYDQGVMSKIYACKDYSPNGRGMNKYGALFGWAWDPTYTPHQGSSPGSYRLFRIKQVFFQGNEMVEVHHGADVVFCRYFNGNSCSIVSKSTSGSGSCELLRGRYRITISGGGGGGGMLCHN